MSFFYYKCKLFKPFLVRIQAKEYTVRLYKAFQQKDFIKLITYQKELVELVKIYTMNTPFISVVREAVYVDYMLQQSTIVIKPALSLTSDRKDKLEKIMAGLKV